MNAPLLEHEVCAQNDAPLLIVGGGGWLSGVAAAGVPAKETHERTIHFAPR